MTDNTNTDEIRSLTISDFRNLGISAFKRNKDEKTFLKINRSLKRDEIGGLVILLGGNNSGKSNVLDAIAKFPKQSFEPETDYTDYVRAPKKPHLELEVAGGRYGKITPPKILKSTGRFKVFGSVPDVLLYVFRQKESFLIFNKWVDRNSEFHDNPEKYLNYTEREVRLLAKGEGDGRPFAHILRNRKGIVGVGIDEIANCLEDNTLSNIAKESLEIVIKGSQIEDVVFVGYESSEGVGRIPRYVKKEDLESYRSNQNKFKGLAKKIFGKKDDRNPNEDVLVMDMSGGVKETEVIKDAFSDAYGYNLNSNVYRYSPRKTSDSDLTCSPRDPNDFITQVFRLLGYDNSSIINEQYWNDNVRMKLEKDLNEELKTVSKDLNLLLNSTEKEYAFQIRLESELIKFSIQCGENVLNLDHQSEGFRWIFGFFVNFLMSKKFVAGDMVVIDEFGGLLNFGTVVELSNMLRDFGRKHGLTFIVATQNPMVVDIDHLDEVRMVMPRPDGGSDILNDFPQFGRGDCTDVLKPIVASMTVGRNYLRSMNHITVFVESYSDYFFLNAFKRKEKDCDIDFIPLVGITEYTTPEALADTLKSLERSPVLLADENIHDQESIEILTSRKITVYTVSELFDGEKDSVNGLFSDEDAERLGVDGASFDHAACLSYQISTDESISEDTLSAFHRMIDYISRE